MHGFTALAGFLYVHGGYNNHDGKRKTFASVQLRVWVLSIKLTYDLAGFLGDFYKFDIVYKQWIDITNSVDGSRPAPRSGHGLVSGNDGKIYLFGGSSSKGLKPTSHNQLI